MLNYCAECGTFVLCLWGKRHNAAPFRCAESGTVKFINMTNFVLEGSHFCGDLNSDPFSPLRLSIL